MASRVGPVRAATTTDGPVTEGTGRALAAQAPAHTGHHNGLSLEHHPPLLDDFADGTRCSYRIVRPDGRTGRQPGRPRGWLAPARVLRATASTPAPAGYMRVRWFHEHPAHTSMT